jgi:hypothetical protein
VVIIVALVVGVVVLARTGSVPTTVATRSSTTTTIRSSVTTTTPPRTGTTTTSAVTTTTTTTVPPAKVTVLVLNGWDVYHAALYFKNRLLAAGYDTLAPTDAATSTNKVSEILVNTASDMANGLAIASLLGVGSATVVVPTAANDAAVPAGDLRQADIVLVVGEDISAQVPKGYNG